MNQSSRFVRRAMFVSTAIISALSVRAEAQTAGPPPQLPSQPASQEAPPPPTTATDQTAAPSAGVADIVVTANRYSQNLEKVSASVDVLQGQELNRTGVTNIAQALATTPGVNATSQPGGFSINIRGLGADIPSGSTQGSVALEFDGIYNIIALGTTVGFFDTNRVEILKGPQSTLYGPNAEGGIANIISNDPILGSYDGHASLTVGNYGLVRGEIAQNIALGDKLAVRIAGSAIHRNSYFTPDAANNIAQSLRVKILYDPTPDLILKLTYQVDHVGGTGQGTEAGYPIVINKVAPYSGDSINDDGDPWHKGDTGTATNGPSLNRSDVTQQMFAGSVGYTFSDVAALDVTGSYVKISGDETSCAHFGPPWLVGGDGICFGVHEYDPFNQYSVEARLHSVAGSRVQWNVGFYHWDFSQYKWEEAFQAVAGRDGGTRLGTGTNAVYGQLTYPATETFRLIGGLRESWDRRLLKPAGVDETFARNLSHFDFRIGQEWDLSPHSMEYFTVSTGYRPGGITYDGSLNAADDFDSEKTTAYEIGIKNRLFGNSLLLNADIFYYDQSNYQDIDSYAGFPVTLDDGSTYTCSNGGGQPPQCSVPTFNIQNAYNLGAELQFRYLATPSDEFGINATLMKARFSKNQGVCATLAAPAGGGCYIGYNDQLTNALLFYDIAGRVQPHSPTFSATFSYLHTFHFASGATFVVGGDAYHSSGYWVHPVEDAAKLGYQPAYWQGNLQATLASPNDRFALTAFLKNISDYAVKLSTLPAATISDPRTFGATLSAKW